VLALKSVLFFLAAPGTVLGLVPWLLSRGGLGRFEPGPWRWAGALPAAVGLAGLVVCFVDFARVGRGTPAPIDPPRALVVRGLYRHVRNPMYVAILATLGGEVLLYASGAVAAWAGLAWLVFHLFVVLYEEPRLRRQFGAEYEDYLRRVPRWIPRLRPA
jgi:protein-S-isoprenylcysteine O-methyltransferase Ste14